MTEQTETPTADPYDRLERVTIVTDGGKGGRGRTAVHSMTPEDAAWLLEEVEKRRVLCPDRPVDDGLDEWTCPVCGLGCERWAPEFEVEQ